MKWTIDQAREHLGVRTTKGASSLLSKWDVKATYEPHPDSGRPRALYDAQEVREAKAARPGRGHRSDLT